MNWNIIEGMWKELSGSVVEKWGDLTDDEIAETKGQREKIEGLLQKRYGLTQEAAAEQVDTWAAQLKR